MTVERFECELNLIIQMEASCFHHQPKKIYKYIYIYTHIYVYIQLKTNYSKEAKGAGDLSRGFSVLFLKF